jgi:hypothetical protein
VQVGAGAGVAGPVPISPNVVRAPAASEPFQLRFFTVTVLPLVLGVPFQSWLIPSPSGSVHVTVQPSSVDDPALVTVTVAWKPPDHVLATAYVAVHPGPAGGLLGDGLADGLGEGLGDGLADGLADGPGPDPPVIR